MKPRALEPLRWVGGKRTLAPAIMQHIPSLVNTYYEPFLGGGSIFLHTLLDKRAHRYRLGDINPNLINTWLCIKDFYNEFINIFKEFKLSYDCLPSMDLKREKYYEFRSAFSGIRLKGDESNTEAAALFMILNRTAFNALVRYNGKGEFNSAFGKRETVVVDIGRLKELNIALNSADIEFRCGQFDGWKDFEPEDFIYLDPPYHELGTRKIDLKTYSMEGFGDDDEERLKEFCDRIHRHKALFLLSNHKCVEIINRFHGYKHEMLESYKSFSGKARSRVKTLEVLIKNF